MQKQRSFSVDHSEFHCWGLPILHPSCIESQSFTKSQAWLFYQATVVMEGMGREAGGSGGTLDCVISGFYRAESGLGAHRFHPGPFKFPP